MIDLNRLTLGELARIEELAGQSVNAMADDTSPKAKLLTAVAFVLERRHRPGFTYIDAENLTMEQLQAILNGAPTSPHVVDLGAVVAEAAPGE